MSWISVISSRLGISRRLGDTLARSEHGHCCGGNESVMMGLTALADDFTSCSNHRVCCNSQHQVIATLSTDKNDNAICCV